MVPNEEKAQNFARYATGLSTAVAGWADEDESEVGRRQTSTPKSMTMSNNDLDIEAMCKKNENSERKYISEIAVHRKVLTCAIWDEGRKSVWTEMGEREDPSQSESQSSTPFLTMCDNPELKPQCPKMR